MMGTSGPSTSTITLSTSSADRAAIRCSMVETLTPDALEILVFSWVQVTASAPTATRLSRSETSVRTNTTPASDAGRPHRQAHPLTAVHAYARADGGTGQGVLEQRGCGQRITSCADHGPRAASAPLLS